MMVVQGFQKDVGPLSQNEGGVGRFWGSESGNESSVTLAEGSPPSLKEVAAGCHEEQRERGRGCTRE